MAAGTLLPFTNGSGGLETVHVGHLDVHKNEVKRLFFEGGQSLASILDGDDAVVAILERPGDYGAINRIVLGKEHTEALAAFPQRVARDELLVSRRVY